ncbi:MAG: hypothetical protein KF809_15820 [Chloroflexi bacterium]|nr:hypothetical protein [Chloroflexota bacterium]
MTDPLRPDPLGLPLDPDPWPTTEGPADAPAPDDPAGSIDDPAVWPVDRPDDPDGGSLDLPGDAPDAPDAVAAPTDLPDEQLA